MNSIMRRAGRRLKGIALVLIFLHFSNNSFAQLLDSATLEKQKVFESLDESMVDPSIVYRLNLRKQNLQYIPDDVYKLTRLQELNLSRNAIQYVPPEIGVLKNLQVLNLSDNKLKTLPKEAGGLVNLKYLYLKRNEIEFLPAEMGELISLYFLDLWGNKITHLPVQMLELRKCLRIIDMRGMTVKPEDRNAITEMLPDVKIYFSGCNCN